MKTLDELIFSIKEMDNEEYVPAGQLDMLLYSPCPVKLATKERIDVILDQYAQEGSPLNIYIPMGCTSVDPYDPLHMETDPEKLPGMIASIGFGDFFRKGFSERFVQTGVFEAVLPKQVHPMHEAAGIVDPLGQYIIYGLTPYILLIDTRRLGDIPLPDRWEDLLDPCYKGQINMCGDGDDMADAVLVNYYKEYGMEGIERFAANTQGLLHSSRMGKSGGASQAGGIYIIPYFFAETSRQPDYMKVIWPEDGAAASPLYLLAQRREQQRLARLIEFFTEGFGQIESARWFMPLSGPVPDSLKTLRKDARIKWAGWDYIRGNEITAIRDELNFTFRKLVRLVPCDS